MRFEADTTPLPGTLFAAIHRDVEQELRQRERQRREWGEALWTAVDLAVRARQNERERERELLPLLFEYGARPI